MPDAGHKARTRAAPRQGPDRGSAGTRPAATRKAGTDGAAAAGARGAAGTGSSGPRGRGPLRGLLRGLRSGDLETVLLTVAMAAEENRMPSADPDEAARILRFLTRLAGHDVGLPPPPDGSGLGRGRTSDAG